MQSSLAFLIQTLLGLSIIIFTHYWSQLTNILLIIFAHIFMRIISLWFPFLLWGKCLVTNLFKRCRAIHWIFLCEFWQVVFFKKCVYSIYVAVFIDIRLSMVFSYYHFTIHRFWGISLFFILNSYDLCSVCDLRGSV